MGSQGKPNEHLGATGVAETKRAPLKGSRGTLRHMHNPNSKDT